LQKIKIYTKQAYPVGCRNKFGMMQGLLTAVYNTANYQLQTTSKPLQTAHYQLQTPFKKPTICYQRLALYTMSIRSNQ